MHLENLSKNTHSLIFVLTKKIERKTILGYFLIVAKKMLLTRVLNS